MLLPPELWGYIATFLDLQELSRLSLLNRELYDAFLSRWFRHVSLSIPDRFSCQIKKHVAVLCAIRNPTITKRIREVEFDSRWEANLISALDIAARQSPTPSPWSHLALTTLGRTDKGERQVILDSLHGAESILSNITHLSVTLHPGPMTNPNFLSTLLTNCSQTLVDLTLNLKRHLLTPDHAFGGSMTFPQLRSLHVTVLSGYSELLNEVRSLVPEDGGRLDYFSLSVGNCRAPFGSAPFQFLKKLRIEGNRTAMPALLPFVTSHRDQLQEVTLREYPSMDVRNLTILNASILTSLSIGIGPLLEHQAEMFPFLSRCTCLNTLSLSHKEHECLMKESSAYRMPSLTMLLCSLPPSLTHLTLPDLVIDFKLFLCIFQHLPNISSLELCYCYPASEEILDLIVPRRAMNGRRWSSLPKLAWTVQFEDIQAHLKAITQDERDPEHILKHFCKSKTFSRACRRCLFKITTRF